MYTELRSSAKEDDPQPAVEQFLGLHASLAHTSVLVDSLFHTAPATGASSDSPTDSDPNIPEDALKLLSDKRQRATSWVHAALSTDISPITLYNHHKPHRPPAATTAAPSTAVVVLGSPSKAAASKAASHIKPSPTILVTLTTRTSKASPTVAPSKRLQLPSLPLEWGWGQGLEERVQLARALELEARGWFLGFLERFLDAGAGVTAGLPDREQVAGMLSQLKKVNDWLDEIGMRGGEEGCGVLTETIERLRKKIYDYLLTHVESACAALGSGNPVVALSGGGIRQARKG